MTIEIIDNFPLPKQYWAVGSSFGSTEDKTSLFLHNSQWVDGWGLSGDERLKDSLDQVQVDDVFVMKSSSNKGPNRSIAFTRIKAIGIVTGKENLYTFNVNWFDTDLFPIDFDGIWYAKTIQLLRQDKLFAFVEDLLKTQPEIK